MEKYNYYSTKKYTIRSIWKFYQAINLCISFLKLHGIDTLNKKDIKRRNKLYSKIFLNKKLSEQENIKINNFINQDTKIINQGIELMDKIKESNKEVLVDFVRDDFVAILGSEVEEFL